MNHTWAYRAWQAPFAEKKLRPLLRAQRLSRVRRVLDVGCGPGTNAHHFADVDYTGLDINEGYIADARRRHGREFRVADVTRLDARTHRAGRHGARQQPPPSPRRRRKRSGLLGSLPRWSPPTARPHPRPRPARAAFDSARDGEARPRPIGRARVTHWRELSRALIEQIFEPYSFAGLWSMVYFRGSVKTLTAPVGGDPGLQRRGRRAELLRRVGAVLDALPGGPHEMVFVDDGSSRSHARAARRGGSGRSPHPRGRASRNFGHQAAFSAALDHVSGDAVVLMDGDLQDAPEAIPEFSNASSRATTSSTHGGAPEGRPGPAHGICAVVPADRLVVGHRPAARRRRLRAAVAARRGYRHALPERQRYLRGLRTWVGFRADRHGRRAARTLGRAPKYTLRKLAQLAFDGLLAFSVAPLRAAAVFGAIGVAALAALRPLRHLRARRRRASPEGFTACSWPSRSCRASSCSSWASSASTSAASTRRPRGGRRSSSPA